VTGRTQQWFFHKTAIGDDDTKIRPKRHNLVSCVSSQAIGFDDADAVTLGCLGNSS
jgi:hypothetical protein